MSSEVNEMWFVLLHYFRGSDLLGTLPDEIHFMVDRAECETRFENQQYAAVKKKTGTEYSQRNGDDAVALRTGEPHDANGDTGSNKHPQA